MKHIVNKTWLAFQDDPLCRPGVQILVAQQNERGGMHLVIGDINAMGGSCDDCPGIHNTDLVLEAEDLLEGRRDS